MAEDFQWDDDNISHIWRRHRVRPHEAEEAIADPHVYPAPAGEPYEAILGLTEAGRLLWVLFEYRGDRYRVGAARDANIHEQRLYWEQR